MSKRTIRSYDKEFKINAVSLYKGSGKSYSEISKELGIPAATLVGWVKDQEHSGAESFPGKGNIKQSDMEVVQLRKELAIVREERDILKKALGIFSSVRK
jgi:transposase